MALKPAICTQCGANIEVDDSREAGICRYCGTAFITEKVIANYTNNYTTVNNITNHVTKIINSDKNIDDAEVQCNNGLTNLRLKKYSDAESNFEKAVKLAPEVAAYYMYKYIAYTDGLKKAPYRLRLDKPNDISSFFELATDEEKQKFTREYGMDFSCYEAFIIDEAEALYLSKNFGGKSCAQGTGNEKIYDAKSVSAVTDVFDFVLKQEKYIQAFREKVYKTICDIFRDKTPGTRISELDYIKFRDPIYDFFKYSKNNYYDPADSFCLCLYEIFSKYVPDKKEEMYDLLAQRMFYLDEDAGTLYLKSARYLPRNFRYATVETNDTGDLVTVRADDESIHTIVFGAGCAWFERFVLTPNITEVKCAGVISADYSVCRRAERAPSVNFFEVGPGCDKNTVKSVESSFEIREKKRLAEELQKKKEEESSKRFYAKLKRQEKLKKTAIWGLVILGVVAFIAFIIFGSQAGL